MQASWLFIPQDFGRGRTLTSRCDFSQNLQKRGCEARFIEYPTSSISIMQSMPLSSKGSGSTQYNVVQIMPQKISVSLRPGKYYTHKESGITTAHEWEKVQLKQRSFIIKNTKLKLSMFLGVNRLTECFHLPIQETRHGLGCRWGRWRTTQWISTTWWTSLFPWKMIWTPSVTWAPSWPRRWASSPATSGWALAPLWTKTCPPSPTRHPSTRRIRAMGG